MTVILLIRGTRLLVLHFQFVNHLLDVWYAGREFFNPSTFSLRVNLAGQGDHAVLNIIFHRTVKFVPNQDRVEIPFNAFVKIGVHLLRDAFITWWSDGNLVGNDL
jgi:hypothetical protein